STGALTAATAIVMAAKIVRMRVPLDRSQYSHAAEGRPSLAAGGTPRVVTGFKSAGDAVTLAIRHQAGMLGGQLGPFAGIGKNVVEAGNGDHRNAAFGGDFLGCRQVADRKST